MTLIELTEDFGKDYIANASIIEELAGIDTGDIVRAPGGVGVVAGELRENFTFPEGEGSGDENTTEVEAGSDNPAYVVGFGGKSAVYRNSALDELDVSSPDGLREVDKDGTDGDTLAGPVSQVDVDEDELPEGWDKWSLVSFYASQGGEVSEMVNALQDEQGFDEESATELAASMKDMTVGTERWRNRF